MENFIYNDSTKNIKFFSNFKVRDRDRIPYCI